MPTNVPNANLNGYVKIVDIIFINAQVKFLLDHNANPYIMDLTGRDSCDLAQQYDLQKKFKIFNQDSYNKKIIPMLPNGHHANPRKLPFFIEQKIKAHDKIQKEMNQLSPRSKMKKMKKINKTLN